MINNDSLRKVDNHWAVLAVGEVERDRGLKVVDARLVKHAVGRQMQIDFAEPDYDSDLLRRLAMAYEMAAIEGLGAVLNPTSTDDELRQQCVAGAWRAFEIRRLFNLPEQNGESIFHILHLSALAYCGDRWSDLRRWYNENEQNIPAPSVADVPWDRRLLYKLFECWISLFRKKGWNDLDNIRYTIIGLREDQKTYESGVLNNGSNAGDRAMALRLVALYHWAKSTELLSVYMLQGEPSNIATQLDKHFESGIEAATAAHDAQLEVLLRWLHVASRQMVAGSIWWVARAVNSRVAQFVKNATKQQALFELLPPQRTALQEQGLLDQASTAVVVEMPTSGGKTLLAQFRILQALNQFDAEPRGWVAYVAPTRALTAQITRRLRRDFEPIGVQVEQLTGAVEIDTFEDDLLSGHDGGRTFDIIVATPEKLQLVIRNKKVSRPLALIVMDEAHNIEDETRGLRIELLLATIKQEYQSSANFLLLMPYVEKAETLARWLAHDVNAGRTISMGTTPWKPNERIVGIFQAEPDDSVRAGWRLKYQTLTTTPKTIHLEGEHLVGSVKPLKIPKSKLNQSLETAAMAKIMSERGTSIAVATRVDSVWSMARKISETLEPISSDCSEIELVQKFLRTEISPDFELVEMLFRGVGVHHAGLSDEVRALIEWLAEEGKLRVLCTTTTIAQGINFPVSSVFLSSRFLPYGKEMKPRDFWNLSGRAGRMGHDSVGVVGLAAGKNPEKIVEYVSKTTGELVSRLVNMLKELEKAGNLNDLSTVIQEEQWDDFRCYVAHLWNEKKNLDAVLADTDQLLRNTYGYGVLSSSQDGKEKANALLDATRNYARKLADNPGQVELADMTGFSPEGVGKALAGLNQLERKLTAADWTPDSLFGSGSGLADLFGVMLKVPQLKSLTEIGGEGIEKKQIANITNAWVSGESIQSIARQFFEGNETKAITDACKAIYRNLVNTGTWGLSALSQMSGVDFDSLPESECRRINTLPAMIYHGVKTEEAVLMRMNFAPRSVAENLGREFRANFGQAADTAGVREAREFLKNMDEDDWKHIRPEGSHLSGSDYRNVWGLLSGEQR
ncbi:MAG: DEAD/DEAH box helicase [Candidatus Methanogaster sp.]|uniref:DEAD/DEAH box helicase n=1 Tax=Candidatus Methanogaster sp. TaxID=3386292 RepID=A0AC61L445_9EURY|nr:MAG: DEAD/DEAH box helicase [ANME-2 cluster archaeon]